MAAILHDPIIVINKDREEEMDENSACAFFFWIFVFGQISIRK